MRRTLVLLLFSVILLSGCGGKNSAAPETQMPSLATELPLQNFAEPTVQTEEMQPPREYPVPQNMVFVAVTDYIPDIQTDLKYATQDNFTGQVIYEFSTVYLRYGTVAKLAAVQEDLRQLGLGLKVWDGFRPVSAQFRLWEVCPDKRYVANPNTGFSSHSRGNTVDVTIVDGDGKELIMPTGFDDFTARADRDYSDCSQEAADNALILEALMEKHGFTGYRNEWWHFTDIESYPVEETFDPSA